MFIRGVKVYDLLDHLIRRLGLDVESGCKLQIVKHEFVNTLLIGRLDSRSKLNVIDAFLLFEEVW